MLKQTYNKDIIIQQVKDFIELNGKFPNQSDLQKNKGFEYGYSRIRDLFDGIPNLKRDVGWLDNETVRNEEEYIKYIESKGHKNNECLEWVGVTRNGYGAVSYKNTLKAVHRLIYELYHKILLSKDEYVLHSCHNKKCFNINHLRVGTAKDNQVDNVLFNLSNYAKKDGKIYRHDYLNLEQIIDFYANLAIKEGDCLILKRDYCRVYYQSKSYTISRLIVHLRDNLNYDDKLWVTRHICNNKNCINSKHLISGSTKDNSADTQSYNKQYKLNKEQVLQLLVDWKNKKDTLNNISIFEKEWAEKLNVSKNTITSIRLGYRWVDQYKEVFNNG